jgi:hypothetical protein
MLLITGKPSPYQSAGIAIFISLIADMFVFTWPTMGSDMIHYS